MPNLVDEIAKSLLFLPTATGNSAEGASPSALDRPGRLALRSSVRGRLIHWGCLPPLTRPTGEDPAALRKYLWDRNRQGKLLEGAIVKALRDEGLIELSSEARLKIGPIAACYNGGATRPAIRHAEVIAVILDGALKQQWIDTRRLSKAVSLISQKLQAEFQTKLIGSRCETLVFFYASPTPMEREDGTAPPRDRSARNHLFAINLDPFGRDARWSWRHATDTSFARFLTRRILLWEFKSLFRKLADAGVDVAGALRSGGVSNGIVLRLAGVVPLPKKDSRSIPNDGARHQRLVALSAKLTIVSLAIILVAAIAVSGGWVAESWKFAFAILGMIGGAGMILGSIVADDAWSGENDSDENLFDGRTT